jgi:hypothetical protein
MVMSVMLGLFLLCILGCALYRHCGMKSMLRTSAPLAMLAVALLSYHALTLPYRAAHHMQWISLSESPIWRTVWQRPEEMPPVLKFMADGGVNAGCAVDPVLCDQIHARRAEQGEGVYTQRDYLRFILETFASHPLKWLAFKLSYLRDFWLEGMPESALLTLLLPLMLVLYPLKGGEAGRLMALFLLGTAVGITGPLLLAHVEPRYLYQLRLLVLYAAIMGPCLAAKP